ncbi:hypothetical protein HK098_005600 [Nowakowskiella sp. JEL0407]|nr:hypothetical protein HK098_005600 [Nowakowskiella sp. JEL0407]
MNEEKEPEHPAVVEIKSYLNTKVRVSVLDGRVLIGNFVALDYMKNVLLNGATQYFQDDSKFIGMIMVPGSELVKFEVLAENVAESKKEA